MNPVIEKMAIRLFANEHGGEVQGWENEPEQEAYRDDARDLLRDALEAAGAVHLRDGYPDSIQSDGFGMVVRAAYGERGDAE